MYAVLRAGGFTTGSLNFDAKIRPNSIDPSNLFEGHIGGMAVFVAGLVIARRMIDDGRIGAFVKDRSSSFDSGDGAKFEKGEFDLQTLAGMVKDYGKVDLTSGNQGRLKNIPNSYLPGL
ncbi:MAG: hypothetical protein LBD44_06870 [Spirochaetaceae bacterium]|jgi:xylose isomerase|nr:hypothetical protein [Spirochaetaceae bacterium]